MPELPEVETAVRALRAPTLGRTIQTANFPNPPRRMTNLPAEDFAAQIAHQQIQSLSRRAKYLIFQLSRDVLIIHLKMTGFLYVVEQAIQHPMDKWLRVSFMLDNGHELRFSDSRRFGRVYLAATAEQVLPLLGPEPLGEDFTLDIFREQLIGRTGRLKPLLLDQAFVAGIGNIYADEALHLARLHPLRTADTLNDDETARLFHAIKEALSDGLANHGASIGWYRLPDGSRGQAQHHLRAYRTKGDQRPCPVCGTPITTIRLGQRGTHFCPTCQPEPK